MPIADRCAIAPELFGDERFGQLEDLIQSLAVLQSDEHRYGESCGPDGPSDALQEARDAAVLDIIASDFVSAL